MKPVDAQRKIIEKAMEKTARSLPVYPWICEPERRGFGERGLAVIVGEAGDLSAYANPAKLWKRLGLAPISKDGETWAAPTWRAKGGLSADDWSAAGYNPKRRAEIYAVVGEPLIKAQGAESGLPYRAAYAARRARTAETHPDWSPARSHKDAMRIMTKQLVLDLWVEWRRAIPQEEPSASLLAANLSADEAERPARPRLEPKRSMPGAEFAEAAE